MPRVCRVKLNRYVLRYLRERRQWTISQLAGLCGVSQPNMSRLESGERQPSWDLLQRLAAAFEIDHRALLSPLDDTDAEAAWPYLRGGLR
jgi:transcriptional regulator with XRE-family HTH domain